MSSMLPNGALSTYVLNDPFTSIVEQSKKATIDPESKIWQSIADALQTAAIEIGEDYRLENLAKAFQLSGELIGV